MEKVQSQLVEALKQRGMRVTPQRAIILEAIESLEGHITAEDIYREVQKVNAYISLATVYRTLDLLQDMRLISPTNLGRSQTYFALKSHSDHHHLVCLDCGRIEEFSDEVFNPVREKLESQFDYNIETDHMSIFGLCKDCKQKK